MFHPVIRIISFLVLAAYLATAEVADMMLAAVALALLYLLLDPGYFRSAWRMIRRMRWFFLSILIIYFWFTPGQPALGFLPLPSAWLPSEQGLRAGSLRIATLLLIILAVNLLLRTTPQKQLIAAIHWLSRPLAWLGICPDRLAVRMVLVMESLATVQSLVRQGLQGLQRSDRRLRQLGHFASDVFLQVTEAADRSPCHTITLQRCVAPPLYQWLYPVALGALFSLLN